VAQLALEDQPVALHGEVRALRLRNAVEVDVKRPADAGWEADVGARHG